jgi:hypothetical protein
MKIQITLTGTVPDDFDLAGVLTDGKDAGSGGLTLSNWKHRVVDFQDYRTIKAEAVDPEPEYKVGQVWKSSSGVRYLRNYDSKWLLLPNLVAVSDRFPMRPLTLVLDS